MKQNNLALTEPLAGDKRRAVTERRDHAVGERRVGLRENLRRDLHIFG